MREIQFIQSDTVVETQADAWRLASIDPPATFAALRHLAGPIDETWTQALPAGPDLARYRAIEVSDSGPATEHAAVIMLVAFNVPDDQRAEVDLWYAQEHIPLLLRADGWLRARRYDVVAQEGGPAWTSLAFHELRDVGVLNSPERAAARSTPWRAQLAGSPWFEAAGRWVYARL